MIPLFLQKYQDLVDQNSTYFVKQRGGRSQFNTMLNYDLPVFSVMIVFIFVSCCFLPFLTFVSSFSIISLFSLFCLFFSFQVSCSSCSLCFPSFVLFALFFLACISFFCACSFLSFTPNPSPLMMLLLFLSFVVL